MKVGKFKIGRYHAIIKKIYEDGSIDYETQFSDSVDLSESVYAIRSCIGELVGIATDNPCVLKDCLVIIDKENIVKELECRKN